MISLYARGMSTRDIHDQLQDLYGIELSAEMVSKITDKILPQVKEWQSRPLNPVYPFVFMDCIHYKVREDGRILSRAAYVVLGVTVEGYKDIRQFIRRQRCVIHMLRNSFKYVNYNDLRTIWKCSNRFIWQLQWEMRKKV